MAAINFPDSPSDGDTHVVGQVTYTYNSAETKWKTSINANNFLPTTGGTLTGNLDMGTNDLTVGDVTASGTASLSGLTYPTSDGTSGQYLQTNGAGALSWQTIAGGKILQITQGTYSTQTSTTSQTYQDTNLSASITPSASDSKILVLVSAPTAVTRASNAAQFAVRLVRDSTPIWEPAQNYTYGVYASGATTTALRWMFSLMYLDSPGTTSSITYKTQHVTYNSTTTAYAQYVDSPSYMYLVEVAA